MNSENGTVHKMNAEEVFQQKLTQLEMGYSLEESLADAPEQEARLLQLAVALQATPFPAEDEDSRRRAARAATPGGAALNRRSVPRTGGPTAPGIRCSCSWTRRAPGWTLLQRRELAFGLSAALVLLLAVLAWAVPLERWPAGQRWRRKMSFRQW
jgi:hypothetical protein